MLQHHEQIKSHGLQIVRAKMENPDNEDIIIPVCILLIIAGIQQYIATFFPFPVMFYLPVLTMCFYLLMML
jgi:hypothetical protein